MIRPCDARPRFMKDRPDPREGSSLMRLEGKRICILVEEGFEDLEFWVPLMRMEEEGARVTVVGPKSGRVVHSKSGGLTAFTDPGGDHGPSHALEHRSTTT